MDKDATAADEDVLILSYPRYCRYRAALCRLAESSTVVDALSPRLLAAVGLTADLPPPSIASTVRVLFCRATVVHPALQKHAFRLDELGTKLATENSTSNGVFQFILLHCFDAVGRQEGHPACKSSAATLPNLE